jgi:hypothetical protein
MSIFLPASSYLNVMPLLSPARHFPSGLSLSLVTAHPQQSVFKHDDDFLKAPHSLSRSVIELFFEECILQKSDFNLVSRSVVMGGVIKSFAKYGAAVAVPVPDPVNIDVGAVLIILVPGPASPLLSLLSLLSFILFLSLLL